VHYIKFEVKNSYYFVLKPLQRCKVKLYEIKAVANYLKRFNFIKRARRVANNTIELNFSKDISIYFD